VGEDLVDDRYELRALAGSGGMADVFLAYDRVLDRDVALKLLKDRYAGDEDFVERFRREA
jgi:serine/threonine-protein kinase